MVCRCDQSHDRNRQNYLTVWQVLCVIVSFAFLQHIMFWLVVDHCQSISSVLCLLYRRRLACQIYINLQSLVHSKILVFSTKMWTLCVLAKDERGIPVILQTEHASEWPCGSECSCFQQVCYEPYNLGPTGSDSGWLTLKESQHFSVSL